MADSSASDSSANGHVILNHYVQTPDHIYLSPAFYSKTIGEYKLSNQPETLVPQNNFNVHSAQERLSKMIVSNEQHNRTSLKCQNILINTTNATANSIFEIKTECCDESISSNGDYSIVDEDEQMSLSVRRNTISTGDDFEEEFDEDSNDTRSCSSSSGCSSSSNSMVGSVNRHLSLNNPQYQQHRNPIIATTTTCSIKNGAGISSSPSQYKDLTPKQVKRRFDWDSAPESPMIAKTTVNGKPVSVRTFKLSNAMKQSLVAAGCSKAVAVAAVAAAFKAKDNSNHDKLIASSSPPVTNGNGPKALIANHQSPTAIAIVTRSPSSVSSPLSSSSSKSPTVHTIVTSNNSPISNGATLSNSTQSQVIFKTPLAPKSSPSPTSIPPTNQHQFYIVNGSCDVSSLETSKPSLKTNGLNVSANGTHLTPILANAVSVSSDHFNTGNDTVAKGSKRVRPCNGDVNSKNIIYQDPVLPPTNGHVRSFNSSVTKTPKANGVRTRTSSIDSPSKDLNSPCGAYSSPLDRDDMSSSSRSYNTSPSPYSPSNSFMDSSNGKSGRTRYETSLGQLTRKFISLLEKSPDGSINLNEASTILQVQKRRIYDITNVLEGVGLLHKTYKNNIQWRGGLFDYCAGKTAEELAEQNSHYRNRKPPPLSLLFTENQEEYNPLANERPVSSPNDLEDELNELENDENRLNDLLEIAHDDLSRMKSDMSNMLYASYMDLRRVPDFAQQTVIGIRPPSDTTLEVPDPSESLQMYLKNARGEMIEVYLCPQISEDEENVPLVSDKFQKSTIKRSSDKAQEDSNKNTNLCLQSKSNNYINDEISLSSTSEQQLDINGVKSTSEFESGYNSYFGSSSALGTPTNSHPVKSNGQSNSGRHTDNKNILSSTFSPTSLNCESALSGVDIDSSLVGSSSAYDDFDSRSINAKSENNQAVSDAGNNFFAHAFISHDDEFGPMGSRSYLTQTEDQFNLKAAAGSHGTNTRVNHTSHQSTSPIASSLIPLEPPVTEDDYNFTLCENEGIGQLFDDSDFGLSI